MPRLPPNRDLTRDELLNLDKNVLVSKIVRLESHNLQLKNIINKHLGIEGDIEAEIKRDNTLFIRCDYRRVLLRVMYFGWDYKGLAVQEGTSQTIEHHLFKALMKGCLIERRETSNYHRCGRTDKGVSAFGQVISISLRSSFAPEDQNLPSSIAAELPYCKILNRLLPKEIRVVAWMPIPADKPEFSARFDCKKRQYKYYFPRSMLDINAMRAACAHLVGSHDFRNLCKMDVGNGVTEFCREIFKAEILPVNEESETPTTMYYVLIEGNAFLWHQIRCIMGVVFLVGERKEEPSIILELLDIVANPRKPHYFMALDVPLNLFHCSYELEDSRWVYNTEELKTLIIHVQKEWTVHQVKTTMIKDCLEELESEYAKLKEKEADEAQNAGSSTMSQDNRIIEYSDYLTPGLKPKVYKPIYQRGTCSSLEERMAYYAKKRRLDEGPEKKEE
ncbi:hypothetical protein ACJJTC_019038 [Scirpophaga incertulas]